MSVVTVFENINKPKNLRYVTDDVIFERIKSGGSQAKFIGELRAEKDKTAQKKLKETLPGVLWSGKFKHRSAAGLLEYSKLIVLDFDNVLLIQDLKKLLETLPWVYAYFDSPTGTGLKVLVRVSSENHLGHFKALEKFFQDKGYELDPSGKDICRAAFFSYDPYLYVNKQSDTYSEVILPAYSEQDKYNNLKKWLENKGEYFTDGNRNSFLVKIVGAANRFGIDKEFLLNALDTDFPANGSDYNAKKKQSIIYSIYTNHPEQHGTVSFEESFSDKKIDDILSTQLSSKDIITVNEVQEDLYKDFDEGLIGGKTTYFPTLDDHFRWMPGEVTALTGLPNFGKSSLLRQLAIFRAAFEGKKAAFISMEEYPPVFFYREIIRTIVGKPLERDNPTRMTRKEYETALKWVNDHFFYIYPDKDDPTPDWAIARFTESCIKHGTTMSIIDPHNSQAHDYRKDGGRDDRYIANMLRKYQRFALQNDQCFIDVAHTKGIGKKEDGTYKEPTADEISGGPVWWQCCDNIMVFHRPNLPLDFTDPICTIKSVKIKKQQLNGTPGSVELMYNKQTGRYYENGYNPLEDFKL
jgi:hypothetical protein